MKSNIQRIVYRNRAFDKMFGMPASRTDITIGELIPEKQADGRSSSEHFAEHNLELDGKNSIRLDFLHKRVNGDIFETESTLIVDERNRNNYMIILKNLTDFRKKEFELAQSVQDLNTNNLIQIITNELKINIEEKNAKIQINHLPEEIKGDRTRLRQLFQNLISNALKFVKSDIQPNIAISSEEQPDCWKFLVKDNGIGIEAEFQERIFGLFKRLHTKAEYEGTGIGLAMCQKIVEQHNGKISVESEFGKGSTFYFTISKDL